MVGVSYVFLHVVLVCLMLLGDESGVASSEDIATTESARPLNFRHTPGQSLMPSLTASVFVPMAATKAWVMQIRESSAATSPDAEQKIPAAKSPSIIQMLEGRENDLILGLSIAVIFFVVGWICGGNYYLRRDRARRRKLRF
jgi:hypothetical protein